MPRSNVTIRKVTVGAPSTTASVSGVSTALSAGTVDRIASPRRVPTGVAAAGSAGSIVIPGTGGVVNGELFSTKFDEASLGAIFAVVGDFDGQSPSNAISLVTNGSHTTGSDGAYTPLRAMRYQWTSGFENYLLAYVELPPGPRRKTYCRIHFKLGGTPPSGIQKTIRYRPYINGSEQGIGTFNMQGNRWRFDDDGYTGQAPADSTNPAYYPSALADGQYHWLEVMNDHTNLNQVAFALWVDGVQQLNGSFARSPATNSTIDLRGYHIFGTYNSPANTRTDYVDKVDISESYMGVP